MNALDNFKDHLVSEKLFCLIIINMLSFPAERLMQQHPETLKGIAGKLIPLKGIKRKEFEGTEFFFDFNEPEKAGVISEGEEIEVWT